MPRDPYAAGPPPPIVFLDTCTVCQRRVPEDQLHEEWGRKVCSRRGCMDDDAPENGGK